MTKYKDSIHYKKVEKICKIEKMLLICLLVFLVLFIAQVSVLIFAHIPNVFEMIGNDLALEKLEQLHSSLNKIVYGHVFWGLFLFAILFQLAFALRTTRKFLNYLDETEKD